MRRPGRLREKAAQILAEAFPDWDVAAEDIILCKGFWLHQDVYRWQVVCYSRKRCSNGDRITVSAGCWDTLTVFVRDASKRGCLLEDGEIWAKGD